MKEQIITSKALRLKEKWRCLKTEWQMDPANDIVVKCVCLLHNMIIGKVGLSSIEIPMESVIDVKVST